MRINKLLNPRSFSSALLVTALTPVLGGATGGGCGPLVSESPAPDVAGAWSIDYENDLHIKATLGGSVYTAKTGAQGGAITIDHQGQPFTFELDCAKPEVICPTEVWPAEVTASQRNKQFLHRMFVEIPVQTCDGRVLKAEERQCGEGTSNPDCDDICDGELETKRADRFGLISEAGDRFDLFLGAGVATNGVNCGLLGLSVASAKLETTGDAANNNWKAESMSDGKITTGYAGGCLWAGDPNGDGQVEAIAIGATLELSTSFSGARSM